MVGKKNCSAFGRRGNLNLKSSNSSRSYKKEDLNISNNGDYHQGQMNQGLALRLAAFFFFFTVNQHIKTHCSVRGNRRVTRLTLHQSKTKLTNVHIYNVFVNYTLRVCDFLYLTLVSKQYSIYSNVCKTHLYSLEILRIPKSTVYMVKHCGRN